MTFNQLFQALVDKGAVRAITTRANSDNDIFSYFAKHGHTDVTLQAVVNMGTLWGNTYETVAEAVYNITGLNWECPATELAKINFTVEYP